MSVVRTRGWAKSDKIIAAITLDSETETEEMPDLVSAVTTQFRCSSAAAANHMLPFVAIFASSPDQLKSQDVLIWPMIITGKYILVWMTQ